MNTMIDAHDDALRSSGVREGHLHPITLVTRDIVRAFTEMGFEVAEGPEIETEYFNFDALNVPKDHPARDMQDTFWLDPSTVDTYADVLSADSGAACSPENIILRTHTSAVQPRFMRDHEPPFRIVIPGKVFRYEATDATHETQFFQIEGLAVGPDVTLANLKGTLGTLIEKLFGDQAEIHLRPGYFPFVEPGVEIDVRCFRCGGKGCPSCKQSGWIEILGAGMVHPNVLAHSGVDPRKYQGFAFGVGVDRLVMLRYGVDDIRRLYDGDLRLVNQF